MDGGGLLRPFGPSQIALQFSHLVGTFDAPLSQKGLKFWPRDPGEFGRFAERQQAASIQSQRHLLCHLRLRRRRQLDFQQNTFGNIKCQRHSEIITASAEANKPSTGPRSLERGIYATYWYRTYSVNASTGPRLSRDTTRATCVSNFNASGLADCRYYCRSNQRRSTGLAVQIFTSTSNPCIMPFITTRRRCFSIESFQQPTTIFSRLRAFFRPFRLNMTK
jgi:hypothetical protein